MTTGESRSRIGRKSTWLMVCVIAVLVAVPVCISIRSSRGPDTPPEVPETEYPQSYVEYWDSVAEASAGTAADPIAEVTSVARGQQLRSLLAGIEQNQARGVVTTGSIGRRLLTVVEEPHRIYVLDCLDLSQWLLADEVSRQPVIGQQVNEPDQAYVFTIAEREGTWYVTDSDQIGTCADAG